MIKYGNKVVFVTGSELKYIVVAVVVKCSLLLTVWIDTSQSTRGKNSIAYDAYLSRLSPGAPGV